MNIDDLNEALSDRYRIERELGRGGMAVVYLAHDWNLGRDVALKVLLPELAASLGGQRFLREIEIAAKLSHPNILSLHDRGEVDGLLYYTMPYVNGESLRDRLDREKQLPMSEALKIASEVADALAHAHSQGVVHRDIKPENILLQGEHALVADFGIARAVTEAGGEKLTQTGIAVGTVTYMAPEQSAAAKDVDARSDLYSLGCVLYEMIGGEPPFTGPSAQAIMARHALDPPPAVSTIRPATPPGVEEVILRSLAKNAVDRYKTAEHMRVVLSDPEIAVVRLRGRLSRLMRTRPARAVLGVVATAAVAFGVWQLLPIAPPVASPRAGVVVVLPFEVSGDLERPLDAVSITNLLRNYFGYTERYRVVPAELVHRAVEELCPTPPIERFCGSRVATELEAQFHLTGTVTPVRRDSVQIVATLTDEMEGRSIPPVAVRGSQENAYEAISRLYRDLAAASAGEGEPVVANAATTANDVAFGALLDGELALADWNIGAAQEAYERAVEADSSFALAWYRLAILYDWGNRIGAMFKAVDRAEAHSEKLSEHDRRVLAAFRPLIAGRTEEAEAIYLDLLEDDPDDVEVLFQLGLLRWAYNWRLGRSKAEAVEPLKRVLELAPKHGMGAVYLSWSLAASGDFEALDSLQSAYPDLPWTLSNKAIRSYRTGDAKGARAALDSLATQGSDGVLPLLFVLSGIGQDLVPDLERMTSIIRPLTDPSMLTEHQQNPFFSHGSHIFVSTVLASMEAGRGRWATGQDVLEQLDSIALTPATAFRVSLATALPDRTGGDQIRALQARIEAWDPPPIQFVMDSLPLGPDNIYNRTHGVWGPFLKIYLAGLLKSQAGNYPGAREDADRLEAMAPNGDFASIHRDLAHGVRADVLFREGKPEQALAVLERTSWAVNYNELFFAPMVGGEREVFLRARVLQQLERYQEALALYTFGTEGRYHGLALLAPSHLHRGEIHEALGNTDEALRHYEAFVELWRDADPEYLPMVEDARERMARLTREG